MNRRVFNIVSLFIYGLMFMPGYSPAEPFNDEIRSLHIRKTQGIIVLDGELDEEDWDFAEPTDHFHQTFPFDTVKAISNTIVKLTYDKNFLYVGIIGYDQEPGPYTIESFKRDFFGSQNDVVNIVIDPYGDQTNAFLFGLSPFGVMREAFLNAQAESSEDAFSWDNKWFAKSKIKDGHWTGEMAIPFKTLRYKAGSDKWKINFYRLDTKQNERSSWIRIPRGYQTTSLAFTGDLIWDEPLKKQKGPNISIIPYLSGGVTKDYQADQSAKSTSGIGGDVKVGLTPSLNLDLTINPDFSQVEVDQQVTNLSRFEIFFPEKRQFFLENADLFENFGNEDALPFFSRRIGIAYDSALAQNVPKRVLFGARVTGKLDDNWRIGLLSAQVEGQPDFNLASQNYSVAVIQRNVFKTSNISAIFTNKQGLASGENDEVFNRVAGIDYNLNSQDGVWKGKAFYHQSMDNSKLEDAQSYGGNLEYRVPAARVFMDYLSVGENYQAATGFVPRRGFNRLEPGIEYNIYPKSNLINRHILKLSSRYIWNLQNDITDRKLETGYELYFSNNTRILFDVNTGWIRLLRSFDPTNSGGVPLEEGTAYDYQLYSLEVKTNKLRSFFAEIIAKGGKFYNGRRIGTEGNINYRISPFGIFTMNYAYNMVRLPEPYSSANILLLGPGFGLTFSRSVFLNTFIQYNNQLDNFNINARMQWRFKPASDFFLVYTDNYFPEDFSIKNRSLVAKLTYWFSI
tara:strand:+ start:1783 stop:3996 length:2214 start_codon:yes stop_codon:yes gene_type:complete